jgi:hypothetical protein
LQPGIASASRDAAIEKRSLGLHGIVVPGLSSKLFRLLAVVHRRQRDVRDPAGQILASGIGELEAIAARHQQKRGAAHIRESFDDSARDRDVVVLDGHRVTRLRRGQDLFQIVDYQEDRLLTAGRVVRRARALQEFPEGAAQRRRILLHGHCPPLAELLFGARGKRIQHPVEDVLALVGLVHDHGLMAWQSVGDARRQAGFAEPAHAVDQHPGAVTKVVLLVPEYAQNLLSLTPATDEAAGRSHRHFLLLVEEFPVPKCFWQIALRFAERAHRPAAVAP